MTNRLTRSTDDDIDVDRPVAPTMTENDVNDEGELEDEFKRSKVLCERTDSHSFAGPGRAPQPWDTSPAPGALPAPRLENAGTTYSDRRSETTGAKSMRRRHPWPVAQPAARKPPMRSRAQWI